MTPQVIALPLDRIHIGGRLRSIDQDYVAQIANSMGRSGQHTPIHVGPANDDGLHPLIAGAHRCAAAQRLGLRTLNALIFEGNDLETRLLEIDENLLRRELSELDRAVFLAERKGIYEALYPETGHGKASGKGKTEENFRFARPDSFATTTAQKLGVSDRQVRTYLARARIEPDLRAALAPIRWADHGATLDALVRLTPEERRRAVHALTRAEEPATNLAAALAEVKGVREAQRNPADEELARLQTAWRKAGKKARQQFLRIIIENEPEARRFVQDVLRDMEFEGDDRVTRALRHGARGEAA